MQIKKVAVLTLALAFVAGFFAPVAKAEVVFSNKAYSYQTIKNTIVKIVKNERLPFAIIRQTLEGKKAALGNLAQQMIKKHKNVNAYYNAVIIYATHDNTPDDFYDYTDTDVANVKKYARKVLASEPNNWRMYYAQAFVLDRRHNLCLTSTYCRPEWYKQTMRQSEGAIREVLVNYEKVGKILPAAAPWEDMAELYSVLDKKQDASRCRRNAKEYKKDVFALEEQQDQVREELQKLFA